VLAELPDAPAHGSRVSCFRGRDLATLLPARTCTLWSTCSSTIGLLAWTVSQEGFPEFRRRVTETAYGTNPRSPRDIENGRDREFSQSRRIYMRS